MIWNKFHESCLVYSPEYKILKTVRDSEKMEIQYPWSSTNHASSFFCPFFLSKSQMESAINRESSILNVPCFKFQTFQSISEILDNGKCIADNNDQNHKILAKIESFSKQNH